MSLLFKWDITRYPVLQESVGCGYRRRKGYMPLAPNTVNLTPYQSEINTQHLNPNLMRQFEMARSLKGYVANTDFQDFGHISIKWKPWRAAGNMVFATCFN